MCFSIATRAIFCCEGAACALLAAARCTCDRRSLAVPAFRGAHIVVWPSARQDDPRSPILLSVRPAPSAAGGGLPEVVESEGLEPTTSALQRRRSTS
jgi:hypothetical protein